MLGEEESLRDATNVARHATFVASLKGDYG
jgi:hypothetical protein